MDGLRATCQPGFDGGLPQSFLLEVRIGRLEGGRSGSGGGREAIQFRLEFWLKKWLEIPFYLCAMSTLTIFTCGEATQVNG